LIFAHDTAEIQIAVVTYSKTLLFSTIS